MAAANGLKYLPRTFLICIGSPRAPLNGFDCACRHAHSIFTSLCKSVRPTLAALAPPLPALHVNSNLVTRRECLWLLLMACSILPEALLPPLSWLAKCPLEEL